MPDDEFLFWLNDLLAAGQLSRLKLGQQLEPFLKRLEQLKIDVEQSEANLNLIDQIQLYNPDLLGQELQQDFGDSDLLLDYFLDTPSTNLIARQNHDQAGKISVVICERQSQGRGRLQRSWFSPFGKNIYCSIGLTKTLAPELVGNLSILTGLALAQVLIELGVEGVQLKWPNDVLIQGQKIGGILIESRPISADQFYFVIGFGLNLLMNSQDLQQIPQAATSLHEEGLNDINKQQVLRMTVAAIVESISGFSGVDKHQVSQAFEQLDAFKQQHITLNTAQGQLHGINLGIDEYAALRLQTSAGIQSINAAEIVGAR